MTTENFTNPNTSAADTIVMWTLLLLHPEQPDGVHVTFEFQREL